LWNDETTAGRREIFPPIMSRRRRFRFLARREAIRSAFSKMSQDNLVSLAVSDANYGRRTERLLFWMSAVNHQVTRNK
jgi:hypothetical protein